MGLTPRGVVSALRFASPLKSLLHLSFIITPIQHRSPRSAFSTTKPAPAAQNRIYDSIRDPGSLHNLVLFSSSSRTPLITLWKTSWSSDCRAVEPILQSVVSSTALPPASNGESNIVGYAEVELDAPDMADVGLRYGISAVPTLMLFDRQEAQTQTKVTDVTKLKDETFLKEWIKTEGLRGGEGGAG